jgi:ribosome-binding factor A
MRNKDPRGGRGQPPARAAAAKAPQGPSQRQLRAGELVRHALSGVLRETEIQDPAVAGVSVTVSEVRMSPDLRHATCFVQPLGGENADEVVSGLNRATRFLRGRLGHLIDLKFTPDLNFRHDESFDTAAAMDLLFAQPEVQRDLQAPNDDSAPSPEPPPEPPKDDER